MSSKLRRTSRHRPSPRSCGASPTSGRATSPRRARSTNEVSRAHLRVRTGTRSRCHRAGERIRRERVGEVVDLPESTDHPADASIGAQTGGARARNHDLRIRRDIDWGIADSLAEGAGRPRRFLRARKQHFLANDDRVSDLLTTALGNVFGGIGQRSSPPIPEVPTT